jgi:proteasome lid subunit RPN8/RPN11
MAERRNPKGYDLIRVSNLIPACRVKNYGRIMIVFEQVNQIILPSPRWQEILEHCKRKLEGKHLSGESEGRKACGLVAGTQSERTLTVECILPVKKNVRDQEPYKTYIDKVMEQHAMPSKTPFGGRGWITDPQELKACYDRCDQEKLVVFGTYHMHVVPWDHDPLRDTPTRMDTVLAQNSGLFSLIVSMVDIAHPKIRAFYEGLVEKEVPILVQGGTLAKSA